MRRSDVRFAEKTSGEPEKSFHVPRAINGHAVHDQSVDVLLPWREDVVPREVVKGAGGRDLDLVTACRDVRGETAAGGFRAAHHAVAVPLDDEEQLHRGWRRRNVTTRTGDGMAVISEPRQVAGIEAGSHDSSTVAVRSLGYRR